MTAGYVLALAVGSLLIGLGAGALMFFLLRARIYGRGVLAGQAQAERSHGWVPAHPEGYGTGLERRRSPDRQFVHGVAPAAVPRVLDDDLFRRR